MKITKKILVILFIMMVMLGIGISKVDAFSLKSADLDKEFHIGYDDYHDTSNHLFCVEKGQSMHRNGRKYTVKEHIKIENFKSWEITKNGKKKKNSTFSSDYNKKLATAIATLDSKDLQIFLWGYFEKWVTNFGHIKYNERISENFATKKNITGYDEVSQDVKETIDDMEEAASNFEDGTDYKKINYRTITIEGTDYIRVGPYKINGMSSQRLENFKLYDQDNREINDYQLIKYNATGDVVKIKSKDITSKKFYICIKKGSNNITQIKANITKQVNTIGTVTANIYLLECLDKKWQNLILATGEAELGNSYTPQITLGPVNLPGGLSIYKYDTFSNKPLQGARFVIFRYVQHDEGTWKVNNDNGRQYEKIGENENVDKQYRYRREYVNHKQAYYTYQQKNIKDVENNPEYYFETNSEGKINLSNLTAGYMYYAKETKAPDGYDTYKWKGTWDWFPLDWVEPGKSKEKSIENSPQTTNLRVEKVNKMDHNVKLEGIRFRFYNEKYGWLSKDKEGYKFKNEAGQATWFETDEQGTRVLEGIPIGNWEAWEDPTSVPYGYYIENNGKNTFQLKPIDTNTIQIENEQKWVKLSGYVWVDKPNDKELSGESRNDLFDENSNDRLLDGITVKLIKKKDQKTEVIKETTTGRQGNYTNNGHGEYIFENVEIADLPYLYIEFEYDGLTYTNAVTKIHEDNGSKAAEGSERRSDYNERFSEIVGSEQERDVGFAKDPYQNSIGLKYDIQGSKAILKSNELYQEEYDKEKNCYYMRQGQRGDGQLRISADTKNATNINGENCTAYNGKTDGIFKHFKWGQTEVKNINLGLKDRDQPDIALSKDIHNVKVSVNGYSHTYMYNQINKGSYTEDYLDGNPKQFNVGVKFREKSDGSYSRAIYTSDYEYDPNDTSKELKVYVTYELKMVQSNANLIAKVNRIAEYYDTNYTVQHIGTKVDNNGDINKETYIEDYTKAGTVKDNKYQKIIIPCNIELNPQEPTSMYVQFQLDKDSVVQILQDKDAQNPTKAKHLLNNIAEIDSYTILDKKKRKIYAGIDMNSNPGNCTVEDPKTYENDTSVAPGLQLELTEAREMTGKVFEDKVQAEQGENPSGIMVGKVRQGDGIYNENEEGIAGVEVTLKDDTSGMTYKAVTVKEEGDYLIQKDINKTVKDEKGREREYTVTAEKVENNNGNNPDIHHLTEGEFYIIGYVPGDYKLTYRWGDKDHKVQDYKGTIYLNKERKDKTDNTLDSWWYIDKKYNEQGDEQSTDDVTRYSDAMDNYKTRKDIDKQTREVRKDTKQKIDQAYEETGNENGIITKMDSTTPTMKIDVEYKKAYTDSEGREYSYCIDKVDFGIVERAKQDLVLTKRVNTLKATLANGQVVVDVTIDESGKVTGEKNGLTYMKPSRDRKPINGFVRLELDNEVIQGTKLEVGYVIKATNKSELDYIPESETAEAIFYLYGEVGSNKPISMTPRGIIDYLDKNWSFDSKSQEEIWKIKQTSDIEEYVDKETVVKGANSTIGEKIILYTDSLKEKKLIPPNAANTGGLEESAQVELQASKMLSTTDEIALNNEAEEVEVDTEGGKPLTPTPGNYMPTTSEEFEHTESDADMAETTIVTPATGKNLAYILPITIGTTALIILGVGIMVIKKKTL